MELFFSCKQQSFVCSTAWILSVWLHYIIIHTQTHTWSIFDTSERIWWRRNLWKSNRTWMREKDRERAGEKKIRSDTITKIKIVSHVITLREFFVFCFFSSFFNMRWWGYLCALSAWMCTFLHISTYPYEICISFETSHRPITCHSSPTVGAFRHKYTNDRINKFEIIVQWCCVNCRLVCVYSVWQFTIKANIV